MPEEKDKKINYKILTAEHLIEEKEAPSKEVEPKKPEEIKPEIIEPVPEEFKTEEIIEEPKKEPEPIQVIPEKPLSGLVYPEKETKAFEPEPVIPYVPIEKREGIETPKIEKPIIEEPKEELKKEVIEKETKSEPEIFYRPKQEKPFVIPKPEVKEKEPAPLKLFPIFKYIVIFLGISFIVILIFVFKPYEKFLSLLSKKESKVIEEVQQTSPLTQPIIAFPPPQQTPQASITTTTQEALQIPQQTTPSYNLITQELPFVNYFPLKSIPISTIDSNEFKKSLESSLIKQEFPGSLFYLRFSFTDKKLPFDFIFDYFIKPANISQDKIESFKKGLSGNYAFMLYYGYTRKYPIIIFEIKDPQVVRSFNQDWEKVDMANDLKTLFLGVDPGKPLTNSFTDKEINGKTYRIIYFSNNYKLIWMIVNNYLIYATTETGLEKLVSFIIK